MRTREQLFLIGLTGDQLIRHFSTAESHSPALDALAPIQDIRSIFWIRFEIRLKIGKAFANSF